MRPGLSEPRADEAYLKLKHADSNCHHRQQQQYYGLGFQGLNLFTRDGGGHYSVVTTTGNMVEIHRGYMHGVTGESGACLHRTSMLMVVP